MKRFLKVILIGLIISGVIIGIFYYIGEHYHDEIYIYYREHILKVKENIKLDKNEYYKNRNYKYVQNTDDFVAKNKKHLLNIFYTVVNSGVNEFTFYCDDSYTNCITDVNTLMNSKETLSHVNNFVHPYNSFDNVSISYNDYGEVHLIINKVYTPNDIALIDAKVDKIIKNKIKSNMNKKQKIEVIHNYIITHGKYATDSIRKKNSDKPYSKANSILIDGYGLCGAYADAMAIFLEKLGIDNYKIASESHIWNLVKLNNKWLHLDLTWDDPIMSDGSNKLEKLFLLIDNKELKRLNVEKHNYNKSIYIEAA